MDKNIVEIFARMNFYEFLLEIQHANMFAYCDDPNSALEKFRTDLIDRIKYKSYVRGNADEDTLLIQERMVEIAENFFNKVGDRTNDIAKQIAASKT